MEWSKKLLLIGSLFLVVLVVLDNRHGVHCKAIRMSQRSTVNPSEERLVVGQSVVYDHFYLVQQWPATFCKFINCTKPIPKKFTIHGLWPQNTAAWPKDNCCGKLNDEKCKYNDTAIDSSLRRELEVSWPNLRGKDTALWKQEWQKHGACSVDELSQPKYFLETNNLYKNHDLFEILDGAGFKADGSSYCVADMKDAIWNATRLNVIMKCRLDTANMISYLQEIYVCVNKEASDYECCQPSTTDICKMKAVFPAVP